MFFDHKPSKKHRNLYYDENEVVTVCIFVCNQAKIMT